MGTKGDLIDAVAEAVDYLPSEMALARELVEASPLIADMPWREAGGRFAHYYDVRFGNTVVRRAETIGSAAALGRSCDSALEFERQFFYGDRFKNPGSMCGMSARFGTLDPAKAQNAVNVIDAGGDGGCSIWLVAWDKEDLFFAYPKGSLAGIDRVSEIRGTVVVRDWRRVVRIANVKVGSSRAVIWPSLVAALSIAMSGEGPCLFDVYYPSGSGLDLGSFAWRPHKVLKGLRLDEERVI